ncbi:hypothetical protein AB9E35_34165, partial [Rhizobium leguminosarum]
NRLNNKNAQLEPSLYQTKSVDAARNNALKLRRDSISALTTREFQILDLICKGTQNKIIVGKLCPDERAPADAVGMYCREII